MLPPPIAGLPSGAAITPPNGIACSIATLAFLMITNSVHANWDSWTERVSSIIGVPTVVGPSGWPSRRGRLSRPGSAGTRATG